MRYAGRNRDEAAGSDRPLLAVDVEHHFAVDDVEVLLFCGVRVKRRDLAVACDLLDEQICPARLRPGRFEGQIGAVMATSLLIVFLRLTSHNEHVHLI